jgi:hypothetical protein
MSLHPVSVTAMSLSQGCRCLCVTGVIESGMTVSWEYHRVSCVTESAVSLSGGVMMSRMFLEPVVSVCQGCLWVSLRLCVSKTDH